MYISKFRKNKSKVFYLFFKATFGEERDSKNLKSCSTSKALGDIRLKSKDIELIFLHLSMKMQENCQYIHVSLILFLPNQHPLHSLFSESPSSLASKASALMMLPLHLSLTLFGSPDIPPGKPKRFLLNLNIPWS